MIFQLRKAFTWAACAALVVSLSSSLSLAATISYGDFGPDFPPGTTIYQDVRESSGTDPVPPEHFGPPTLTGDTLDFDPVGFVATASGGEQDITDIQLNFDLMVAKDVNNEVAGGLTSLLISESGEFSLFGGGTAVTAVTAGVAIDIDILEVDGAPVSPISVFASNSLVRDLVSDGPVVLAPWSNGLLVEFGPVLVANNIDFEFGVTKAEVVINDQVIAHSEANSTAFIAKKDFTIEPGLVPNPTFTSPVPEPSSAALLMALAACMSYYRRRVA